MSDCLSRRGISLAAILLCCAGVVGWACAARGEGGEPRYFAIKNARIVPVSGAVIENGTVVVAKGLIAEVGTNVTIPPEAWVIDGTGMTVYPGLIDAGTNLGLPPEEGAGQAPSGTGARRRAAPTGGIASGPEDRPGTSPWRVAADELKTDDKRIETWRDAGFTTALTMPDGGIFPGQATVIDLAGDRAGDYVVRAMATVPISLKPTDGWFTFPDSLMGTIGYVRQVFDDTRWYAAAEPIYDENPTKTERLAYDRTEVTLHHALERKEIFLLPGNNSVQILRALRLADEWKIRAVLYGGQQGYAVTDALAASKIPVLVSLKWPERPKDADPQGEQTLRELQFRDRAPGTPAALAKAGVKFAFYSDGLSDPKDIFKSVKKATDAGLAPDAALRALTLDAADILGLSDRMGSISAGKIANLVVTDGDIFGEKTKVKDVFVDGNWFEIHEEAPAAKPDDKKPAGDDTGSGAGSREREGVGR
ncbi:MAG: amidohydrolase family protein [Candidatus Acidiferrales bacterium]